MDKVTVGGVLEKHKADILAQLEPISKFMAAQAAQAAQDKAAHDKLKTANPLADMPWHSALSKLPEAPKPGQSILMNQDGTFKILPKTAIMGAGGGLLGVIEQPVNSFWPTLPLGSVVVGGLVGMTLGELIDGFVPPKDALGKTSMTNVIVKAVGMIGLSMYGSMIMSKTGVVISIGLLGAQLLADLLPVDQWIRNLVNWVKSLFGQAPVAQYRAAAAPTGFAGAQERNDLYAGLFGVN